MTSAANRNGVTSVALSTEFVNALGSLNVQASGFGGTHISNGVARFSITGGAADLERTRLEIAHTGGLTLRAGNTEVQLTDFIITNLGGQTVLTGLLTVNGNLVTRAPLFNLQVGSIGTSRRQGRTNLDLNNVNITLTNTAADALNQAFGVTAFTSGFGIGTAQVDAFFNPTTGNISERRLPIINSTDNTTLFPGATQNVLGQRATSVDLSDTLVNALDTLNVEVSGFGNTRIRAGVADFLITGGATDLDTTRVEILHSGGLTFTAAQQEVRLTDFIISNLGSGTVLSGNVIVNDRLLNRIPLFNLRIGDIETSAVGSRTNLDINDVGVSLTARGARALNQAFGVNAFRSGFEIGTAQVDAIVV